MLLSSLCGFSHGFDKNAKKAGDYTQGIEEIRKVFSMGDVSIGKNGVSVFYFNKDGEWVSQEFDIQDGSMQVLYDMVLNSNHVRFSMMPDSGAQFSLVSDKIQSDDLPTFLFKRIRRNMSDDEFESRVSKLGKPENPNAEAMEIISQIDPNDEGSVEIGLVKWILALTITDSNVFDFSKARDWLSLQNAAEVFKAENPVFSELVFTPPIDGSGYGFAEFSVFADRNLNITVKPDSFAKMLSKSSGLILETARENGRVYINLVFAV